MKTIINDKIDRVHACWPKMSQSDWMNPDYRRDWATVIITTFQRAKYIVSTVESVYRQSYRPIELIVVDDGSGDDTNNLLNEWWKTKSKNIDFEFIYYYQENTGAPAARNYALTQSTGEFIQEVGSDDLIHPAKLETHIRVLQKHEDCQSAWSPLERFTDSEESQLHDDTDVANRLIQKTEIVTQNSNIFVPQFFPSAGLHRRSVFFNAGPWLESLARWQDLEYQSRMAFCINKYVRIDEPLYFFRQHEGERIHSQYNQLQGIESGLESLAVVEKTLEIMANNDPQVKLELSKFYLSLATLAARCSSHTDLCTAVKGALRNRNNIPFRIRMRLFQLVSAYFGGKLAYRLSELYLQTTKSLSSR